MHWLNYWSGEAFIMLLLCIENGWFDVTTYRNAVAMVKQMAQLPKRSLSKGP